MHKSLTLLFIVFCASVFAQSSSPLHIAGKEMLSSRQEAYFYIALVVKNKLTYATIDLGNGWQPITDAQGNNMAFKSEIELYNRLAELGWRYHSNVVSSGITSLLFEKR